MNILKLQPSPRQALGAVEQSHSGSEGYRENLNHRALLHVAPAGVSTLEVRGDQELKEISCIGECEDGVVGEGSQGKVIHVKLVGKDVKVVGKRKSDKDVAFKVS